jgi:hypothetical protein
VESGFLRRLGWSAPSAVRRSGEQRRWGEETHEKALVVDLFPLADADGVIFGRGLGDRADQGDRGDEEGYNGGLHDGYGLWDGVEQMRG